MSALVVDSGVMAAALSERGSVGQAARARLRGQVLWAPALLDVEVVSVLRGLVRGGLLPGERAVTALGDLAQVRIRRVRHEIFTRRCWELRDNVSPYEAVYVALAEALGIRLLTGDRRLSRATGPTCIIETLVVE